MDLKGKLSLITGATSGIGKACAYKFAEAGSNLILIARREEKLNEIAKNLKEKFNVDIKTITLDVRNRNEVENSVKKLTDEWKNIDVLINNAGLARGLDKIQDGDYENWEEMIDTNIKGLLYVSRNVLPLMIKRNDGMVINIGSLAGHEVYPNGNVYCGTKHAVKAISKGMTIDLNGTGVRVVNIDPGLVETEFSEVRFRGDTEKAKSVYQGYEPLIGDDIADIALFAATRPKHVMLQDILVTPTAQATATITHKNL
jgi:3-hydroxy acid dehydrogenase/malonic semialdehyde reductase